MKKIIVIVGPTGVGKTKLSIELAKRFNGEIINADSTQVYKELDIATAKIKDEEMENIPHHLFSFKEVSDQYSVYDYQIDARKKINEIINRNKIAIVVGGSGLYLSALLYDYQFTKEDNIYDFDSLSDDEMYETLIKIDPNLTIDKHNRQRLIRAYAKYINNSEPINNIGGNNLVYDCFIIGLTTDRDNLYNIINNRVDQMIENGLIREAKYILSKYSDTKEIKTVIGYKEFIPYFDKRIGLEEVIKNIKQNSRNYAKRQYTWFNHKMDIKWFDVNYDNFTKTINEVIEYIEN